MWKITIVRSGCHFVHRLCKAEHAHWHSGRCRLNTPCGKQIVLGLIERDAINLSVHCKHGTEVYSGWEREWLTSVT